MSETGANEDDLERRAALRLHLVDGVGPRTQNSLRNEFGTATAVFRATRDELLSVPGVGPKLAAAILAGRHDPLCEEEERRCRALGADLLLKDDDGYPARLAETLDAPWILYRRGTLLPADGLAVAIVGTRNCTLYGRQQAERLAGSLARAGVTIVSGLAKGIDAAAHRGALAAGGRTIAVLATGVEQIYPQEHIELAAQVMQQGALVSEAVLDQAALPGVFPQRNRIISGLSLGVIVVEATRDSGTLHTVRHALEQGREVFAVPGRIDSLQSEGCHNLIRDGATLVRTAEDVLNSLGPLSQPVVTTPTETVHNPRELNLNEQERRILNLVTADPQPIDEVIRRAEIETPRVLQTLTILEMKRLIRRLPGGNVCRA